MLSWQISLDYKLSASGIYIRLQVHRNKLAQIAKSFCKGRSNLEEHPIFFARFTCHLENNSEKSQMLSQAKQWAAKPQ